MKKTFILLINFLFLSFQLHRFEIVSTSSGDVKGIVKKKVILFEDIPYAQPPIGNLRWKAPKRISTKS